MRVLGLFLRRYNHYLAAMRARSIELYLLPSLTQLIGEVSLKLIDEPGRRAFLTGSSDEAALHLRRRNACGVMIASSLMGGGSPGQSARDRFDMAFAGPGAQLPPRGDGTLLVVDCELELPDRELQHVVDLGDFAFSLDSEAGGSLGEKVRAVRNSALTALALSAFEGVAHDGKSLGTADILYDAQSESPVYIVVPKASMTMTSKSSLLPEQAAEAVKLARALDKAPKNLRHVPRLLAQSHEARLQPLSAFISAWAGLEILIVATFDRYEASSATALNDALPTSAVGIADRMRSVMKDKYRLADKFAIMASALDPASSDRDLASFMNLKKVRDVFFHTLSTSPDDLPGEATRRLLRKYLTLHLQQM